MNKLGLSSALVAIIAAILSFIVIASVVFPAVSNAREGQAENLCKTSVAIRAGTAVNVGPVEIQTSPLLCKTLTSEIKQKGTDAATKIKYDIANKMTKCWEIFGEGTYENSVFDNFNIFGGGKGCFTCYVLPIEETNGFKEGVDNIPSEEFMEFLRTTEYPAKSERTYLQYFTSGVGAGSVLSYLDSTGIKPNGAYAISYKAGTGNCEWCGLFGGSAIAGAGLAVAAAGGAILFIIPEPSTTAVGAAVLAKTATAFGTGLIGKGLVTAAAGTTIAGASAINLADTVGEAAIDTIILSDMSNPQMAEIMRQSCNFVEDVEGKKLR
jgi:hypothetical protein